MASPFVFISHSTTDTWVARKISLECRLAGADTFLDSANIEVAANIDAAIQSALNISTELVVLFTPWSLTRPYVWLEIGAAWNRQIPIVGVLYGMSAKQFEAKPGVPNFLKSHNLIDINSIDRYFEELKVRIERAHAQS